MSELLEGMTGARAKDGNRAMIFRTDEIRLNGDVYTAGQFLEVLANRMGTGSGADTVRKALVVAARALGVSPEPPAPTTED